jgi:hypothetical protein
MAGDAGEDLGSGGEPSSPVLAVQESPEAYYNTDYQANPQAF